MLRYLRKPATMETSSKIANMFLDNFMTAAWYF